MIAGGAIAVLALPDSQLVSMAILSQVLNRILLPVVIVLMLILINRKDLMGEHSNSRLFNAIAWVPCVIVIGLSVVLIFAHHQSAKAQSNRYICEE